MDRRKHHTKHFLLLISLLLLIPLSGCSILEQTPSVSATKEDVLGGTEGPLPKKFQLHDVPHNPSKQKGTDCAPDSLRMVLNYRGQSIANDQEIVRKLTRRGTTGGTSFRQMQEIAAKDYGLPAFIIHNCDLGSLKAAIVNKWPPMVSYRVRGSGRGSIYHAVVAVGYDDKRRTMSVHDPNYPRVRKIRYDALGGVSGDSGQRLSSLLVLPAGMTEKELRRGLGKYVPKELVEKLRISSKLPS